MKKVLVRGPLLSQSGYGEHSRQVYQFCDSQKDWEVTTQVLGWGITGWCVNDEMEGGLYGRIMSKSSPITEKFDITFQIQLPNEWDPNLGLFNVGVTAGVETDRCPIDWATTHREKMDLVIVPSAHTRSGFTAAGTGRENTPIKIIPESYFEEILKEPESDLLKDLPTSNNFLLVGTLISDRPEDDRKNIVATIRWFMESFHESDDVGLVIKTSRGRDTAIDREVVRRMLKNIKSSLLVKFPPKIYMLHGSMTREEMTSLYKSPKTLALISATRGEGFGLPMIEAAVAGLPVVATDWSAHTEFLSGTSFLDVSYDLIQIPGSRADGKIFAKGSKWAEAREGNFKKKLVRCLRNKESLKKSAKQLASELQESHSLKNIFTRYEKVMKKALEK